MNKKHRLLFCGRIILALLILLNMTVIYVFSSENAKKSSATSEKVTQTIVQTVITDFNEKPREEQKNIVSQIHGPLRKIAHMVEFGALGTLTLLFLLTWGPKRLFLKYLCTLLFTTLYAISDECHQMFSAGRSTSVNDVQIDLTGALICTLPILLITIILLWSRSNKTTTVTHVYLPTKSTEKELRIAVAADLHNTNPKSWIQHLNEQSPDLILIPGDLMEDGDLHDENANGYKFLKACAAIAPTFYSLGNHEIACYHKGRPWRHPTPIPLNNETKERIATTGATLLDNAYVLHDGISVCGLTSGINGKKNLPDPTTLALFAALPSPRILLCHHPEYYVPHIQNTGIELTVCGHAHGGHWRFFHRGVYAPGQGLFPKYTDGVLDNRCVISRGMGDHTFIPRISNPRELIIIHCSVPSVSKQECTRFYNIIEQKLRSKNNGSYHPHL